MLSLFEIHYWNNSNLGFPVWFGYHPCRWVYGYHSQSSDRFQVQFILLSIWEAMYAVESECVMALRPPFSRFETPAALAAQIDPMLGQLASGQKAIPRREQFVVLPA